MIAHKANKPGKCPACHQDYTAGVLLLLADDKKEIKGCAACPSLATRARIARLSTPRLQWEAHTSDKNKPFLCEGCRKWGQVGTMRARVRLEGEKYAVTVACGDCPDLTAAEKVAIAAGMSDEDKARQERKEAEARLKNFTPEELDDPEALQRRTGSWAAAWEVIQRDPSIKETAKRRKMDPIRLGSAFALASMGSPGLRAANHLSHVNAYQAALELGVYPAKGPLALAYLIPRGEDVVLQPGYKLWADMVHTLRDVTGVETGIAWKCEVLLGNLAAPYHAVQRAAQAALRQGKSFDLRLVEAARHQAQKRGAELLAQLQKPMPEGKTVSAVEAANLLALRAALEMTTLSAGAEWFDFEWFRHHEPSHLLVQHLPPPGTWERPRLDNAKGIVPAAAWALVRRTRGHNDVVMIVDAQTVMEIAVKGRNAKLNSAGGLDGDVWGENQSAGWMWRKTALIQATIHGQLPLRDADPERMELLQHLEVLDATQVNEDEVGAARVYSTVTEAANDRAAAYRRQAAQAQRPQPAVAVVERPALTDGGEPEEPFEWPEERELEPVRDEVEQPAPAAAMAASAVSAGEASGDAPSAAELADLERMVGPDCAAAARSRLRLTAAANLDRLSPEERRQLAGHLEVNVPPDERRWSGSARTARTGPGWPG